MTFLDETYSTTSTETDCSRQNSRRRKRTLTRTGRYRKGEKLGEGGCGVVFKGIDLLTGGFVAVKELKGTVRSEVADEMAVLKILSHENIVKLYDFAVHEANQELTLYLELIEGGSLNVLRRQYSAIPKRLVANYTEQLLQGLSYLHAHGVLHLDLKPANILVSSTGIVKIVDFGTSIFFDSASAPFRGTPLYSAPEAVKGFPLPASDIWSLGVTVFEMLEGVNPWIAELGLAVDNVMAVAMKIGRLVTIPNGFYRTKHAVFSDFIERCMTVDPCRRASCEELLCHAALVSPPTITATRPSETSTFYDEFSPVTSPVQEDYGTMSGLFVAAHHYEERVYHSPFTKAKHNKDPPVVDVAGYVDGVIKVSAPSETTTYFLNSFFDKETQASDIYTKVWVPAVKSLLFEKRNACVTHSAMVGCGETGMMLEGCFPRFLNEVFSAAVCVRGACFTATQERNALYDVINKRKILKAPSRTKWEPIQSPAHCLELINYQQLLFLGVDSPIQIALDIDGVIFALTLFYGSQWNYFASGLPSVLSRYPMPVVVQGRSVARHPIYQLIEDVYRTEFSFNYVLQSFHVADCADYLETVSCLTSMADIARE
eukprot:TRINITY_DN21857_c0_g1_i1.p1 TRINITY_DN21857_c0_g1~~TRINITY_DN21857_c0_g1_i1.p1  ORF type:complete len:618 (+),score=89.81 TRINITY_DN21857_c0_g1_i1:55-1854(+)